MTYVGQPVGPDGQTNSLRANARRENLRRHNPVNTPNTKRKVGDVDPDEHGRRPPRVAVRLPRVLVHRVDGADDELRDAHAGGADEQDLLAAPAVHEHDGRNGGEEIDDADDACCEEVDGVAVEADLLEDLRRVVYDGVDA